jgi:hypothetical protein
MSVVVCTYDEKRRPLLERALEALEHQEQPPAAVTDACRELPAPAAGTATRPKQASEN